MLAIKKNLKDDNKAVMYCEICHSEYSATAGDYWNYPDEHEFKCCGKVMQLGTFVRVFVPVEEASEILEVP
jgi:hypothetical protein